ncbi:serine-rich adhesin for platelets-like [Macrobrachium rosenbergii]|uniref:serine-rich adhesin for platelets-like n=1 Tax=Macrobrachium rosenbergii TaxID=79674 RepID=UPI0034D64D4A
MECDVEGQPNDEVSPNEGVLKGDMEVKNDVDISVSSSSEGDKVKLGTGTKSDEVLTSGETENSLGDLTETNPCREDSLETVGNNAKAENEKSVDEKLENQNPAEKCISDAIKNTVAEDAGKICDKLEEPNSANKLVDKSRIDLLDGETVTDVEKSFESNSSVMDIEPKSPEIGFRRKSFSQFSPLSSPVKSPSQMSETSPVRSPELGGRRRLKVHVFDRELADTSKQEQSSERKKDEHVVKEGKTHSPDLMGKEKVAENQESSPSQTDNTASTSPCFEEEGSRDLNVSNSDKCARDVMEGEFFNKHTQEKPMPCSNKLPETSELSKEANPLNKPLLSVERKLSLSFHRRETTSLSAKGIDENESDLKNRTSSEDFYKEKDSDPEKPEDGTAPGKSENNIAHEEPEDSITPEKPEDIIAPKKPEDNIVPEEPDPENLEDIIPSEKPEDSIAPENPEDSISSENYKDSIPSENSEDSVTSVKPEDIIAHEEPENSVPSENSEDSMTSEKPEDKAHEEPENIVPSENTEDSMTSEKPEDIAHEEPENIVPSENIEDSMTSEKPEDIAHEEPENIVPSENTEDSMTSEKPEDIAHEEPENMVPSKNSEDSMTSEKPEDIIAHEEPENSVSSENSEDSMTSEKPEDIIAHEEPENIVPSENSEDSMTSEKPEDIIAHEEPENSVPSENSEDSMTSEKPEDKAHEEPENSVPSENSEDSMTSEKPEDIIAHEEPENIVPSENSEDSMTSEKPEDIIAHEVSENSVPSENSEDSMTSEKPEDKAHEEPENVVPSENSEDSMTSEKPEDIMAHEEPVNSVPSENAEDSLTSEKPEDKAHEEPENSVPSENTEDSITSEKPEDKAHEEPENSVPSENAEDSITSEKPEDKAQEEPKNSVPSENPEDSMPYENPDDSIPSESQENSIVTENPSESTSSENHEDSIHSEKLENSIGPENPDESIPSENPEDSVHSDKYEDIAPEKPMVIAPEKLDDCTPPAKSDDSKAPEKPKDSLAHEKPENSVASKKPEKPEDSIAFQDEISSTVDNDGSEISLTEKSENSATLLQDIHCASDSDVSTEPHGILKSDGQVKNNNDRQEKDIDSDLILHDVSGNRSVQCSADTSNKREYDDQLLKVAREEREETHEGKSCEEDSGSEEEEVRHNQESPSVEKLNNLEINKSLVKKNEFSQAQEREVHNDSGTDLDVIGKNRTLLNEFQNKSGNRSESETHEESAEKRGSLKIVLKIGSKRKSSDCEKETLGKKVGDKCDESRIAPAEFEGSEKRLRRSSEIGNFHEDENVCHKKVIETKSVGSPDSGRKYPQDGEENLADCSQEGESQKGCEELESGELLKANYKEEVSNIDKSKVNKPSLLSLSKRRVLADQVGGKDNVKPLTTDAEISTTEEKARTDERSQEDIKKVGIVESDQGSGSSSDGNYEGMRVSGEDTEKDHSLPESDILNSSERVQSITSATLGNEKLQLTGDSLGGEGSGGTHVMRRKKRSRDSDHGKLRGVPGPKCSKVSLDTRENTDHSNKDDVEVSSSGTSPVDMKVEFVDISSEEEQQSESRYVDAIDMICKKCRDIWNDEVLRMIFKGTESVTVNSKITYGAIVCINDWINRNLSVDKEEAITQVFERTDLGSNIAQLNISKLDQWLGELLHRGKNKCCKVFTAVYQPKKDTALHKTKTATKRPKVHIPQSNPVHAKNQKSAVSKGQKSLGTKGPSVAKSQSLTGNKSQSPTVSKGQGSVIATCPDLPKGRVYLVPAPAVASVLPSAISAKSLPSEESAVLPSSASSLMKPCKIILKNPVPVGPKGNTHSLNRPSTKSHPSGSPAGLKSGESKTGVNSKFASRSSIGKPGLSSGRDKSLRATVHGNTFNSKQLSKTGVNKVPSLQQARPLAAPLSKMMSQGQNQRAQVKEDEQDELEDVKDFVTEVESMIFSQEPVIREMLQALNLDIKDVNIYSSYCNIPITNKMKVDCPSERDKISPCYFSMLKERSALNGHALIAFDLLLYESNNQHSVASLGSTKSRFVTKRELLTLQSIFILNPETPDISLFYEVFVQILLSRKKVLLIPDSHTFLVVTEDIRKEYNRAKSKDLSIQLLNENWDPNNIYSADDAWLEGQNLEEVTNRDVISIFCTWRNLGKEPNDQSLSKALQSLRQFHNIKNGDYFGSCFRLYTKFIRFVYEEKDLELAKVFLDEPFIGGCCIVSKKFLQNLINFNKQKNNLPNYDDDVDNFKDAVERFEDLEAVAYESLNAPILRDLCSQMIVVEEKMKVFIENNEVISKRLTGLLGKREKLLREIKGPEIRRLVQTMRTSIVELHKVAQKRRQENSYNKKNKRRKCDLDMTGSDLDSSCTDVSPHMKELIKDLLSKGVKPEKVRQVIGIVSGITKEEKVLEVPSEKWILNFAQMYS